MSHTLTEEELVDRILVDTDPERRKPLLEELWRRYERTVDKALRNAQPSVPSEADRESFLEQAKSEIAEKLLVRIDAYRKEGPFSAFARRVIMTTAVSCRRKAKRRSDVEKPVEAIQKPQTMDEDETLADSLSLLAYRSGHYVDPGEWTRLRQGDPERIVEVKDRKRVLNAALTIHGQTKWSALKSAKEIRLRFWGHRTVKEVAESFPRQMTERQVYREMRDDLVEVRSILALRFRITSIEQLL